MERTEPDRPLNGGSGSLQSRGDDRRTAPLVRAQDIVERERAEILAEQCAFEQFADRVGAIPQTGRAGGTSPGHTLVEAATTPDFLGQVRTAYRETVMSMDHYEREYGEPLQANISAELGADFGTAVCEGSDQVFTPAFKLALVTVARQARRQRTDFLTTLDKEATSLADAEETLRDLLTQSTNSPQSETRSVRPAQVDELSNRLRRLVEDRQRLLHSYLQSGTTTGRDLCTYLYQGEEWTHPVLHAAAVLHDIVAPRE